MEFETKEEMKSHMYIHLSCTICGKEFKEKKYLNHLKTHTFYKNL